MPEGKERPSLKAHFIRAVDRRTLADEKRSIMEILDDESGYTKMYEALEECLGLMRFSADEEVYAILETAKSRARAALNKALGKEQA